MRLLLQSLLNFSIKKSKNINPINLNIMRKLIFTTLTIIFSLIMLSCSNNDDDNNTFPFQGHWSGTYSGQQDHGTFSINVSSTGIVTGTTMSVVFQENFDINGNVSQSGQFSAIAGNATSGATFTGQMSGNSSNGTWINNSAGMNGTWSGNKN